ncbi:MAG: branched-chain amino acid ABC transporter permease [Gammaproteobacteria bacterium]|nr:MAG: branched-chain amino acid ABC transporter permease [Gammaproteobacteria bacterium]
MIVLLWILALIPAGAAVAAADETALAAALEHLAGAGLRERAEAVETLAALDHPRVAVILQAYLDGRLYVERDGGEVLILAEAGAPHAAERALDGAPRGRVDADAVKRIGSNNALRKRLRILLALRALDAAEAAERRRAAETLIGELDAAEAEVLRPRLESEPDRAARAALAAAVALVDLDAPESERRLAAIDTLRGRLEPQVRGALARLAENDADPAVAAAATRALRGIQTRLDAYAFVEKLLFGLSLGSILVLAAIGLAITFGVMGVINMAHGELIMLGAYTTYAVQRLFPQWIEWSLLIAVPAAFLFSGAVGVLIERGVIRHLYGRPLETLLATFGISLILQQSVRSFVSAQNVAVVTPSWLSGAWQINPVLALTYNRLWIFAFALVVFFALLALLRYTALGIEVRAVAQNRAMARALGVRSDRVDALTFGLGAGIAGVAGVALSQLTNVGPNLGQDYIIDSFMVVVFGGVGNLWGTLVGGLSLGVFNKFMEPVTGAVLAKILVLVFIILFIQKRPQGVFPQRGRAAEG